MDTTGGRVIGMKDDADSKNKNSILIIDVVISSTGDTNGSRCGFCRTPR